MSHTDPLFAIPAALVLAVGSLYAAGDPETVLELYGGGLVPLFGDRWAPVVLRLSALVTAGLTGWLLVHALLSLAGA